LRYLIFTVLVILVARGAALGQRPRIEYGSLLDIPCTESGVVNVFVDTGTALAAREAIDSEFIRLGMDSKVEFRFAVRDDLAEADTVLAYSTRIDLYADRRFVAVDSRQGMYTGKGVGYVLLPRGGDALRLVMQFRPKTARGNGGARAFARAFARRFTDANRNSYFTTPGKKRCAALN
jgi:hypothetical protein